MGVRTFVFMEFSWLLRLLPGKVIHLNPVHNYVDLKDKSFADYMNAERTGLLINFDSLDKIPKIDIEEDQAGVQHPKDQSLVQDYRKLKLLTSVKYADDNLEAKIWPHLFPFGIGGWKKGSPPKQGEYLKHRLLNYDVR